MNCLLSDVALKQLCVSPADLIRAAQKDEFFLLQFQDECRELAASMLGRHSTQYEGEVELFSNAAYYGLTTLLGKKTLGEEYCDLLRTTPDRYLLSRARRTALLFAQVVVPYLWRRTQKLGRSWAPPPRAQRALEPGWRKRLRGCWNKLLLFINRADPLLAFAQRFHLAVFYLYGTYLHISHRAVGIRHLYLRKLGGPGSADRPSYRMLGYLLFIQLFITAVRALRELSVRRGRGDALEQGAGAASGYDEEVKREDEASDAEENAADGVGLGLGAGAGSRSRSRRGSADSSFSLGPPGLGLPIGEHRQRPDRGMGALGDQGLGVGLDGLLNEQGEFKIVDARDEQQRNRDRELALSREERARQLEQKQASADDAGDDNAAKCALCLSARKDTTATECGHLFCWTCIAESLSNKPECPLCRQPSQPQNLLVLAHYQ